MYRQWALRSFLGIFFLAGAGPLFAQAINQSPELCYLTTSSSSGKCSTYGQGGFGTYIEDSVLIRLTQGSGVSNIDLSATDPDGGSGVETTVITLSCNNPNVCALYFGSDPGNDVTSTAPNVFVLNANLSYMIPFLSNMAVTVASTNHNLETLGTVTVVMNDNGNTGACSSTDPTPCNKYATWVLHFDAAPSVVPDRIFLDGFEQQ